MEMKKIKDWLIIASKNIINRGDSQDIHIDEFVNIDTENKEKMFYDVLMLANEIRINLLDEIKDDYRLFLYLALDSNTNSILGVPRDYTSLLNRIDTTYPPELVLYKEFEKEEFNKVELYKSCLPFDIEYSDTVEIIYRELRSFDELICDGEFTRELHLIIK